MKRNKGITLIALIITILVMLILVGVTVNVIINSNILGSAKNAGKKWKDEAQKEATEGKITISGIEYESIDEYVSLSQASLPGGTRVETPTPYTVGGKTAVIPAGFTVSGINSERTIDGGLVIYDIPKPDLEAAGEEFWTAKEKVDDENSSDCYTVQKNYNQFVWVPVETPYVTASELAQIISNSNGSITTETAALQSLADNGIYPMAVQLANGTDYRGILYTYSAGTNNVKITVKDLSTTANYDNGTVKYDREPAKLSAPAGAGVAQTKEEALDLQTEYNNIVKSVANQKGFWVARYELSYNTTTNKGESKRGNTVAKAIDTNTNTWYGLYDTCQGMYTGTTKSTMISGSQWDQIIIWMKEVRNIKDDSKYYILDSSYMGNYNTSAGGTGIEQVSGYKDNYAVKQIFDLGGNLCDWTTTANSFTVVRVARGYSFRTFTESNYRVSGNGGGRPDYTSLDTSARTILYVTL